MTVHPKRSTPK